MKSLNAENKVAVIPLRASVVHGNVERRCHVTSVPAGVLGPSEDLTNVRFGIGKPPPIQCACQIVKY